MQKVSLQKCLQNLPWIGSYFGLEEPAELKQAKKFNEKKIVELELHVLCKDYSVKTVCLRYSPEEYSTQAASINLMLRNIAYLDKDAVAHMVYCHEIDSITGIRIREGHGTLPAVKVDSVTWKWFDHDRRDENLETTYHPDVCRQAAYF